MNHPEYIRGNQLNNSQKSKRFKQKRKKKNRMRNNKGKRKIKADKAVK